MNKKAKMVILTIAFGTVMLGATAYGAISGTSGYDLYKQALKNTIAVKSISPDTKVTVKDNGNLLVTVDSATKINKTDKTMSNNIAIAAGNQKENIDIYQQNGKTITKSSNSKVYNVVVGRKFEKNAKFKKDAKFKLKEKREMDPNRIKDIENVVDAVFSNVQNYITLKDNSDGTKDVTLDMSQTQVSPVINAITSLFVKNVTQKIDDRGDMGKGEFAFIANLKDKLPKLVGNIQVNSIDVDAKINNDNLIQGQTENVVISGTDANGQTHQIEISITTNFTGFNSTTPDKINLKGKQVKVMEPKMFNDMRMERHE